MPSTEVSVVPRSQLHWAAKLLSDLADQLDENEALNHDLVFQDAFRVATHGVTMVVTRARNLRFEIFGMLKVARAKRKSIDAFVQKLKAWDDSIKHKTLEALEAVPNIPYKDDGGQSLTVSGTGDKLILPFEIKEKRTWTNIIGDDVVTTLDIPDRYLKRVDFLVLDTAMVKADLKKGVKLVWASTEKGKCVKGWGLPKEEKDDELSASAE